MQTLTSSDIAKYIEEYAPLSLQEEWDNCGWQLTNGDAIVSGVMLCVDITESVIHEAIEKDCNFILSHHPLIFDGLKKITDEPISRCVRTAIEHNIALYSAHTNIDKVFNGVSAGMCKKLKLNNCKILESDCTNSGFGMIGTLNEPINCMDFLKQLQYTFNPICLRHSQITDMAIKTVAVCGGSGSFLISRAKELCADIFVTADLKYHDFFKADERFILADIGHFESEQYTKEIFFEILSKKIPTFAILNSEKEHNPIYCL